METEIPASELTSGYQAEGAHNSVGEIDWKAGVVSGKIAKQTGNSRKVILSRWAKPIRIVPDSEVAAAIKKMLEGTKGIAIPNNVVTPSLLAELEKQGVPIDYEGINRLKKQSKAEKLLTPSGKLYGWAIGNAIRLTKNGLNPNTPIHEYTHLWAKAMQKLNPKGWRSIVDIFKGTELWDEVVNAPNYQGLRTDDDICSEVLARYSGKHGAERMEKAAKDLIQKLGNTISGAAVSNGCGDGGTQRQPRIGCSYRY